MSSARIPWTVYASTRTARKLKYCNPLDVFNKTVIPYALVGYQMVIANSAIHASLAMYHLNSSHIQRALVE